MGSYAKVRCVLAPVKIEAEVWLLRPTRVRA